MTNIRSVFANLETPTGTISDCLKSNMSAADAPVQTVSFSVHPAHRLNHSVGFFGHNYDEFLPVIQINKFNVILRVFFQHF